MSQSENVNELVGALAKTHLASRKSKRLPQPFSIASMRSFRKLRLHSENSVGYGCGCAVSLGVAMTIKFALRLAIYHISGQWLKHETLVPSSQKNDAQAMAA